MRTYPPILPAHRTAPAWARMTSEERGAHMDRVWAYYGDVEGRPDEEEVRAVLRLHTPPEVLAKYRSD